MNGVVPVVTDDGMSVQSVSYPSGKLGAIEISAPSRMCSRDRLDSFFYYVKMPFLEMELFLDILMG